ncbi:MAG: glycosyltransferase [Victivallales bacterium]|nr:glycosyltransferase [Victivallales bacterium]
MRRFVCACCGNCCRWGGYVYAKEEDFPPIAKFLGITVEEFIDKYTSLAPDRSGLVFSDKEDGSCVFQDSNNLCTINPVKPMQCATFPQDWKVPPEVADQCHGHWEEYESQPKNTEVAMIHVLGHPNLPLDVSSNPGDAQVFNCHNFCNMLSHLGIPFCYFGVPGSILPPGGKFVSTGRPTGKWRYGNAWHRLYNERLNRALEKNIVDTDGPQLVMSMYGAAQSDIVAGEIPVVEPMVGYDHCWAPYRVFPSYAQQNIIYAKQPERTWNTRYFDAVIPHFVSPEDYLVSLHPDDYLLYLGRDAADKGVGIARECASRAGLELRMVHGGCTGKAKAELIASARAVIMPTIYLEPFGYVAIEAQMCGTPVITTDWGAFPETVIHGRTGFRCRTQTDFLEAIRLAPKLDRLAIRHSSIDRFSLEKIAPIYEKYFLFVWNVCKNGGYYAPDAFSPTLK